MSRDLLTWRERGWLWLRLGIRLVSVLAVLLLLARFGRRLLSLSWPFLAALIAAVLLDPLVKRLQRRAGWSRQFLTLLLLLAIFGLAGSLLGWLIYAAVRELASLTEHWGDLLEGARSLVVRLDGALQQLDDLLPIQIGPPDQSLLDQLLLGIQNAAPDMGGLMAEAGERMLSLSSFLFGLLFFLMATYLLTADYPYLRTRTAQRMSDGLLRLLSQLRVTALGAFGGYLKAQLLLSGGVFLILLGGFLVTRQPYGLLLAVGLAVLDFIPIIGAGTVMVPWAFIALFAGELPVALRMMAIWGVISLFRRVAEPKFVGDQTGLSPLLSLMSIYVGFKLAGVAGMILAPILLLVLLNLDGMGMFRPLRLDLEAAWRDIFAILSQSIGER